MRDSINTYLNQFDFDIRKSHDARYVDQKCTPALMIFGRANTLSTIVEWCTISRTQMMNEQRMSITNGSLSL